MIRKFSTVQKQSTLRLHADAPVRTDLALRKEIKYGLPATHIHRARSYLESVCRRVVHEGQVSTVRSVYFDDHRLSSCQANLDGIGQRQKMRVRWYDQPCPGSDLFFEVKWRKSEITGKHRLHFSSEKPIGEMSYRTLLHELAESLPDEHQIALLRFPEPIVLVEYKREHFVSYCGEARLTLDYDLKFYNQMGKPFLSTAFGMSADHVMVLEAKAAPGKEPLIQKIVKPLSLRATRSSKYVRACTMLSLIAPLQA